MFMVYSLWFMAGSIMQMSKKRCFLYGKFLLCHLQCCKPYGKFLLCHLHYCKCLSRNQEQVLKKNLPCRWFNGLDINYELCIINYFWIISFLVLPCPYYLSKIKLSGNSIT